MSEAELVREIHHAIDSAPDHLLAQAIQVINEPIPKRPVYLEAKEQIVKKASRLSALGFIRARENQHLQDIDFHNVQLSEEYDRAVAKREKAKEDFALARYYKERYPFYKFLRMDQLDEICIKYGLIHAPAAAYTGDIPEEHLIQLENSQELCLADLPDGFFVKDFGIYSGRLEVETKTFIADYPQFNPYTTKVSEIVTFLKNPPVMLPTKEQTAREIREERARQRGSVYGQLVTSSRRRSIHDPSLMSGMFASYSDAIRMEVNEEHTKYQCPDTVPYFIAAPVDMFSMADLIKINGVGYRYVNPLVKEDPIVFQKCRGGVLVKAKWGIEASDPLLLNPINN